MPGTRQTYPFRPPPELGPGVRTKVPVVIAGAGPVGLAMALDLDRHGVRSIIVDDDNKVCSGSRAICWSKRALEVLDRLGCGERMLAKGVTWNVGKVFFGDGKEPVFEFNMLAEGDQQFPGFINLQQYYVEEYLIDRIAASGLCELRWESRVSAVETAADGVTVTVRTPGGDYPLDCDYLIAADGSRSSIRSMMGLEFEGETFQDHFLIADIVMQAGFPSERWFWFDPPFNRGQSALLHRQPDDVWRLDFQLGWDIDREKELEPERVARRVRAMLGEDLEFEFEWVSIYTFECRQMQRFVHGRVLFIGDAAHLVSPFGARGANSGLQDVDNLGWKLALVLDGQAPNALLESYNEERVTAARENVLNSTRSTDFITPKSEASRHFRDATLELARNFDFARRFVNSGRLSVPCILGKSALNTPDREAFESTLVPGAPAVDAPVSVDGRRSWFLKALGGGFTGVYFSREGSHPPAGAAELEQDEMPVRTIVVAAPGESGAGALVDHKGLLRQRLDARGGSYYLFRPDQHLTARWRQFDARAVREARARATAQSDTTEAA